MQSCCSELSTTPASVFFDFIFDYLSTEQRLGGNVHPKNSQKPPSPDIFLQRQQPQRIHH
jgi:hypothetical protein